MEQIIQDINTMLIQITDCFQDSKVKDAMKYSLLAGGKRIRPLLMLRIIQSYGLDYHDYLDAAVAFE